MLLVSHPYVTRMYLHVTGMPPICTRISPIFYSYVLVCHAHVTRLFLANYSKKFIYRVKVLSPCVYPFRKLAWFNLALQKSKVQLLPPTENIHGI